MIRPVSTYKETQTEVIYKSVYIMECNTRTKCSFFALDAEKEEFEHIAAIFGKMAAVDKEYSKVGGKNE